MILCSGYMIKLVKFYLYDMEVTLYRLAMMMNKAFWKSIIGVLQKLFSQGSHIHMWNIFVPQRRHH